MTNYKARRTTLTCTGIGQGPGDADNNAFADEPS
jgi:hypothetical protein